jgi:hypothetical protein
MILEEAALMLKNYGLKDNTIKYTYKKNFKMISNFMCCVFMFSFYFHIYFFISILYIHKSCQLKKNEVLY